MILVVKRIDKPGKEIQLWGDSNFEVGTRNNATFTRATDTTATQSSLRNFLTKDGKAETKDPSEVLWGMIIGKTYLTYPSSPSIKQNGLPVVRWERRGRFYGSLSCLSSLHFCGRFLNYLPMKDELRKRSIPVESYCPLCNDDDELEAKDDTEYRWKLTFKLERRGYYGGAAILKDERGDARDHQLNRRFKPALL
ncbi:hypothetical protein GOBAR_AA30950 [Gossypium barbadense]|uniref:Uncharacterized protein n=1 Tax=Gossypium barbadense TaxID=3634 RepID=A0A2P5WF77_GOSBA|nr:hypothetical protein GOBAR_AA30950 [Gossypium barbadense]